MTPPISPKLVGINVMNDKIIGLMSLSLDTYLPDNIRWEKGNHSHLNTIANLWESANGLNMATIVFESIDDAQKQVKDTWGEIPGLWNEPK